MSVDEFAAFIGSVPYREAALPWGHAQVWDLGAGRPIVLLHGIAGGRRLFYRLAPMLAAQNRVIVPPLRGEGVPAYDRSPDPYLDDIATLLDEFELEDVTLVGVSFGAYLALGYAARRDPRVRNVVVQGGFHQYRLRIADRFALAMSYLGPDSLGSAYFKRRVLKGRERSLLSQMVPGVSAMMVDWMGKTPFSSLRSRTRMIARHAVGDERSDGLTIAHGRFDAVVPFGYFEQLRARYPDATHVEWRDAGHNVILTHPDRVAALLA